MDESKRDKTKVDPLTDAEEEKSPRSTGENPPRNATEAVIPGTGKVVQDKDGNEAKRVVGT